MDPERMAELTVLDVIVRSDYGTRGRAQGERDSIGGAEALTGVGEWGRCNQRVGGFLPNSTYRHPWVRICDGTPSEADRVPTQTPGMRVEVG